MREIEFRAKKKCDNEWAKGFVEYSKIRGEWLIEDKNYCWYKVYEETIGQYTGLKDKNGKKIFEGDIMSISPISPKYEIKWDNEQQRFCFWNDGWIAGFNGFITSYEVIGNIYDNPELLEVEK